VLISDRIFERMSENYEGKTETEHLIRQAAHELQIEKLTVAPTVTNSDMIGTYTVSFKDIHGNDQNVFVPFDAGFQSIHDALKFAYRPKPKHDPELKV
jgi:hypothetical protein